MLKELGEHFSLMVELRMVRSISFVVVLPLLPVIAITMPPHFLR